MKKLDAFLNILMGSFFGVFIGNTISNYREYRAFPEIYEIRPAPWWVYGALPSFILFIAVVVICVVLKFVIHIKLKKKVGESECESISDAEVK